MIREGAAAVLFAMALGKLIAPREAAMKAWRPKWIALSLAVTMMITLALAEMTLALVALVAPAAPWVLGVLIAGFFSLVTVYGLQAIARTGACGCGGVAAARIKREALLRRNALMLLTLVLGISFGPSFSTLQAQAAHYAVSGGLVPVGGFGILMIIRIIQAKLVARPSRLVNEGTRASRTIEIPEDVSLPLSRDF